jgi:hypothetical protein
MHRATYLLSCLPILCQAACIDPMAVVERRLERSFRVASGSAVRVELSGGSVTVTTGPAGVVHVALHQAIRTNEGEESAERLLGDYEIGATQAGGEVRVLGRRKRLLDWVRWRGDRARIEATITAPADVRLDLDTSGGRITVRGERSADVHADTSGGGISADGGQGDLLLNTSGGSIRVHRVLGNLRADTSGGSISVDYVGAAARDVSVATSGGSIRVGLDRDASVALSAGTSGGSVRVEGLPFDGSIGRSHAEGSINGGLRPLRATTSGGGVTIRAADDPGPTLRASTQ